MQYQKKKEKQFILIQNFLSYNITPEIQNTGEIPQRGWK